MAEIKLSSLEIQNEGVFLPNRYFRQSADEPVGMALIFPGLRYSCDMPLLYFSSQCLLQRGYDVLQLTIDYGAGDFQGLSRLDQARRLASDAAALVAAGRAQRSYDRMVAVGKSIGTISLASLVASGLTARTIWLTPLLRQPLLVQAAQKCLVPALFISSRDDPTYDEQGLSSILEARQAEALTFSEADHRLEVPGDLGKTLSILKEVMERVEAFV